MKKKTRVAKKKAKVKVKAAPVTPRSVAYRDARKAQGLVQVVMWLPKKDVKPAKLYAKKKRKAAGMSLPQD